MELTPASTATGLGELLNKASAALEEANPQALEGVLAGIDYNDERKLGDARQRDSVLNRLVLHFSKIDLRNDHLAEPDMLGRAYEYLIEKFADDAGKKGGEFYTPHMVVRLIVELLEPKEGMRICDPTCGSGGMLIQSGHYIVEHGGQAHNFTLFGQEKNLGTWSICKMNMLLHGHPDLCVNLGDTALLTERVIAMLENADPAKAESPWVSLGKRGRPRNPLTKKPYNGINILSVWCAMEDQGFASNEVATYRQWAELGAQVRKGAKGIPIVFWKTVDRETEDTPADDAADKRAIFARTSWVVAAEQVDNYPQPPAPEMPNLAERLEHADAYLSRLGVTVNHAGNRAYYSSTIDVIQMPPIEAFRSTEAYYGVLAHETIHATGHPSRLNREHKQKVLTERAQEELVAELGSVFLYADLRISPEPREENAAYVKNWLAALKDDKKFIFQAASAAQKAVGYLDGLQPRREPGPAPREATRPSAELIQPETSREMEPG